MPYPCRPESRKRNTCEPTSVSCSLCRNSLPCKQALRVTNIYVLSLCVFSFQSLSSARILSRSYFDICCLPYCCVIVIFYCTAIRATVRELLGRETVVVGIAVIVVHLISPRNSSWSLSGNHCGVQEETGSWYPLCREDVQLKIHKVFLDFIFPGNLNRGKHARYVCTEIPATSS